MPFRKSKRVVFRRNPLAEVICQLRFPPILEIGVADPAEFQKQIRKEYPLYQRDESVSRVPKEIRGVLTEIGLDPQLKAPTHKFLTADSSRLISLEREFVAVTDHDYRRWEQFSAEVERACAAAEVVYEPPFYSRVGLRYRDVIDRAELGLEESPWQDLLKPTLVGVLGEPDLQAHVQETHTETVVRLDAVPGGFVKLRHGIGERQTDSVNTVPIYVIDADFFTAERTQRDDIPEVLSVFNRLAGDLFRWAITDKLREALQPEDIE